MSKRKPTIKWGIDVGDCVKLMRGYQPHTVELAFADPPFNIGYDYDTHKDQMKAEDYIKWCREWMYGVYKMLTLEGSFWLAIGDEFVSELDMVAKEIGFFKRSHVIWYYTFGVACSKNFSRSHTHLLYYTTHKTKFTFNHNDKKLRVPSSRQLVYGDKRANPKGKLPDNTWILSPVDLAKTFTATEDTWLASRICGTFGEREERGNYGGLRGCPQMPRVILDRIIVACSNPDDMVFDPFCGTGTTVESAVLLGRNAFSCDISKQYVTRAKERIKRALAGRSKP